MLYYKILFPLLVMPFFLSDSDRQQASPNKITADNWNGIVTWTKTSASKGKRNGIVMVRKMPNAGIFHLNLRLM